MPVRLSNIDLQKYKKFLAQQECNKIRTEGGHEIWARADLLSCIILQSHVSPVPEFIIRQHLNILGISKKEFQKSMENL